MPEWNANEKQPDKNKKSIILLINKLLKKGRNSLQNQIKSM
jgi:hypothetical protein